MENTKLNKALNQKRSIYTKVKKGVRKNTSGSELGFNNDSQVSDSFKDQQYYKLESNAHECGA